MIISTGLLVRKPPLGVRSATLVVSLVTALGCAKVGQVGTDGGAGAGGSAGGAAGAGGTTGAAGTGSPIQFDASFEAPPQSACGNGAIEFGENCEDGNTTDGDGCSSRCVREDHYTCPMVGKPCVHDVVCGDGHIDGAEGCDDGNTKSGDGCTADCQLECGWECPPGAVCRAAKCGDGHLAGNEQCDDGNNTDGDGCSAICILESRPVAEPEGWACSAPPAGADGCVGPTTCAKTTCGNKVREGSEQCDDGNTATGDGCSPFCRLEPVCPPAGGACKTACGDGLILPTDADQECDDGNTVSGDGCSADCKKEQGYQCTDTIIKTNPLVLPIVFHDFKHYDEAGGHPDFNRFNGNGVPGIAKATLGANGVPEHGATCTAATANASFNVTYCDPGTTNPTWDKTVDYFSAWYTDSDYSKTIVQTLSLGGRIGNNVSDTCNLPGQPDCDAYGYETANFFPLDDLGWGNGVDKHNYSFTSQTRYWFQYTGVATLIFRGDDDVFVYINKTLAVDLGGLHQSTNGQITLDAANGTGYSCDFVAPGVGNTNNCDSAARTGGGHVVNLGLELGKVYEIVVFQAERRLSASNYRLTLSKFKGTRSVCTSSCGDGVVTAPEVCDLGKNNNTGAYGGCNANCTVAPYCGDKIVQKDAGEQCDGTSGCDKNCKLIIVR
jgi:fibro-slime domain-containing protein